MARMPPRHTAESFWRLADRPSVGCWNWRGYIHRTGYGQLRFQGRQTKAHVTAYELTVGPVPSGLELDHLCRNRACVNPAHLEPVTHTENVRRAFALKTACRNGHPYEDNLIIDTCSGARRCRTCRNGQSQRRKWQSRDRHGFLRGEAQPRAKLNDNAVREIRASSESTAALARRFEVSWPVIGAVRNGKTWRHVI